MRTNRLLHVSAALAVTYAVTGYYAPPEVLRAAASIMMMVGSGLVFFRYAPKAFDVVFRKFRDQDGRYGSHLAVLGAALIGGGLFMAGTYTVAWLAAGEPQSWTDKPYGPFGRYVAAIGLMLFFFSPDVAFARLHASRWSIGIIAAILAVIAALFVGIQIGRADVLALYGRG